MIITTIAGNIGKDDAELRNTPQGTPVANFSMGATDHNKETRWFECAIWGKYGEVMAQYLTRGKPVTVVGELSTREWIDREGKTRTSLTIKVSSVKTQEGREQGEQQQQQRGGGYGNRAGGGGGSYGNRGGGGGGSYGNRAAPQTARGGNWAAPPNQQEVRTAGKMSNREIHAANQTVPAGASLDDLDDGDLPF
jgi:single-strand DNA-binding protein